MKAWIILVLSLAPPGAFGQTGTTEVGGYVKDLFSRTESSSAPTAWDNLIHARLNTAWYPWNQFSGVLQLRGRVYYGNSVENTPGFADNLKSDAGFGPLGSTLWAGKQTVAYLEADRLYLNWTPGKWQFTAGRQRIAWGTNLVWNPMDVFNPLSVLDFDYEERPATDAVRLQYYTGVVSKIELVVKPGSAASPPITASQLTFNEWDYDFHILGGDRDGRWFAGAGWAGDILGGGFRGEVLASKVPDAAIVLGSHRVMVSGAVSGDYTFPNSFYIHTEVLYNSEGVVKNASLTRPLAQILGLLSPARWSIYQEFSCDVSPLVRASVFTLVNPVDGSFVAVPSVTWSAATNIDMMFLALAFSGAPLTEFGGEGTAVFGRIKFSF
ncbi:MAG TPA: hypothetical protein VMG09_12830 [Bacteroidota bacterium]|nr:hypothetical protein [Bacteroidota bacterium]